MNDPLGLFDDDVQQDPLGLFAEEPSFGAKITSGLKKNFANLGNTFDTAVSMPAAGLARMAGGDYNKIFKELNEREKLRNEWAGDVDPGFAGNLVGALNPLTLPAQIAAMPFQGINTAKQFIDQGESLPRAYGAGAIDTAANMAGIALPGVIQGGKAMRAASGAGINVAQDALSRTAISGIAENKTTKEQFGPSWESAALAAASGGILGVALGKKKAEKTIDPDLDKKVDDFFAGKTKPSDGYKAGEYAGEVNMELFRKSQAEAEARKVQEFADLMEAQRVREAEAYAAQQFPEQNTTGLSTGEQGVGTGTTPPKPVGPSNLMGVPEGPRVPPVGLGVGENAPGGAIINRPAGPSNLMGEPVPGPVGLSTGEGMPGGRNIQRTPETDSGLMGTQAPAPFDPFGSAGATPRRIGKFGQGGQAPIIGDLAQGIVNLGKGIKAHFTGEKVEAPDTIQNPRSPETIKAKQVKTAKAKAIGLKGTVYDSPTTLEEVKANPGPDIGFGIAGKQRSPGQFLGSGAEATVRRNPQNNYAKYIRGLYSKARNQSEFMVHKYVTGPSGYTSMLRNMSVAEKANAYQLVQKLSDIKQNYTPELGKQLGLSTKVQQFMEARQTAFKGQFDNARQVNESLGLKHFEEVAGYSPDNYDYAYRTLVYEQVKNKDGTVSNKIIAPINGNSIWERRQGEKHYRQRSEERVKQGLSPYKFEVLPTQGLKKHTSPLHRYDGLATLLSKMAELDPTFASAKAEVDAIIAGKTKDLFQFNVHELHKKGVEGAIGKKPWKTIEQNVDDFFKMEIDHLDTGFRYWSYQDAITKARQSVADLTLDRPNTKEWVSDYTKRITGQELNPLGAGLNAIIDGMQATVGARGSKNAYAFTGAVRGTMNAWLMGVWNPTFMQIQLSQLPVNGLVEAFRLRVDLGISHTDVMTSFMNSAAARTWLTLADMRGKLDDVKAFGDFKQDYIWAKEHGLHTYSEVALSHEAAMNPKLRAAKNIIMHPTTLPEWITRPTAFMWYADMMRKAGISGPDAYIQARDATDNTMTNYHPDELPMIYKDLGASGKNIGSLRAFVHNSGDQFIARTLEAQKYPLAFTTMIGMTLLLQGITGLMGYTVANELSMVLTDKTLTEWMESLLEKENRPLLHGVISAMSEVDIQSRFSTADALTPGSFTEAVLGPQFSKLGKIATEAIATAINPNEASFLQLGKELTPSGLAGYYEDKLLTDDQGFVLKEGKRKYKTPRTQEERDLRRQRNLRPLRERLEDEALYRDSQREFKENDKTKTQLDIMRTSLALGDIDGFNQARKKFLELKGNPTSVENVMNTAKEQALLSERERRRGEITDSWSSMRKQQLYKED